MGKGGFRYEYRIPKEETSYVETVMRMYFHKFAYGAGPNGEPVIRTNADADEFRKIRGRAKCLRLDDETGDEHMTEEEVDDMLYAACFDKYLSSSGAATIVDGFGTLEPIPLDLFDI